MQQLVAGDLFFPQLMELKVKSCAAELELSVLKILDLQNFMSGGGGLKTYIQGNYIDHMMHNNYYLSPPSPPTLSRSNLIGKVSF